MLLLVVPLLTLEADARGGHRRSLPKPYSPIVFDDSRALAQGDWCPGPAVTGCQVGCLRELKVFDTSQVLYDVLAIGIPQVDAVSEMRAVVYRHFSLPQSSSASRSPQARPGLLRARRERPRHCAAEQRDERAAPHVWMAPAWQEVIGRAAQRSLAVMCPACWCSPGGLLALMGCANRVLIIQTGSMSR